MTSSHLVPDRPAGITPPGAGPARSRGRRAAALVAAAAPLAAAVPLAAALATVSAAMASAAAQPAAHGHTFAGELLTTTMPATTAGTGGTDPKIPTMVGD
jgi:hypothetical protein